MQFPLTRKSAQAIDCSDPPGDAPPVLDSNPSIKCSFFDPVWPVQLVVGFVVFVSVGLYMPYKLQKILKKARDDDDLYNGAFFQSLFGWMLRKYSGDHYYYEIIVTWRKLAISIIYLLTTKYPTVQILSSTTVVAVALIITWRRKPFRCTKCIQALDDHLFQSKSRNDSTAQETSEEAARAASTFALGSIAEDAPATPSPSVLGARGPSLNTHFKKLDADGSGSIDFAEFSAACGEDADEATVRELFALLDKDGSGTVERKEFRRQLRENDEVMLLARRFKGLGNLAAAASAASASAAKPSRRDDTFKAFDADDDGKISLEEFQAACGGGDADADVVRRLFDLLDKDSSGTVERKEFRRQLRENDEVIALARRFEGLRDLAKGATRKTRKSKMSRKSKMKRKGSRGRSRRSSVAGTPKEKKATGPSLKGMTPQELVASGLLQKVSAFKDCGVTEDGFAHIAETMQMEAFATGARLCTQGEPGHKFFLITEGSCDVIIRGKVVAKLVANDSFGEIAILHDAPRSATVTATSDVVNVLSLTREAFRHVLDSHATGKGVRGMESGAEAVLLNDRLRQQGKSKAGRRKKRRGSVVGADGKSLRRRKSRASQRKLKKKNSRRGTARLKGDAAAAATAGQGAQQQQQQQEEQEEESTHPFLKGALEALQEEEAEDAAPAPGRWGAVRRHVRKSNRARFLSCVEIVQQAARKKREEEAAKQTQLAGAGGGPTGPPGPANDGSDGGAASTEEEGGRRRTLAFSVTTRQQFAMHGAAIAHKERTYKGPGMRAPRRVSVDVVGRQFYKLILAKADLRVPCEHWSTVDILEVACLATEIAILLGALAINFASTDSKWAGSVNESVVEVILMMAIILSFLAALAVDVKLCKHARNEKELRIAQLNEMGYGRDNHGHVHDMLFGRSRRQTIRGQIGAQMSRLGLGRLAGGGSQRRRGTAKATNSGGGGVRMPHKINQFVKKAVVAEQFGGAAQRASSRRQTAVLPAASSMDAPPSARGPSLNTHFKKLDADGSGSIDFAEFSAACGEDADEATVRELFALLDKDGSGTVERKEFRRQLRENDEVMLLARRFKGLGNLAAAASAASASAAKPSRRDDTFKAFDADDDGKISLEEFQAACGGGDADADVVRRLFDLLDKDSSGTVERKEFRRQLRENDEVIALARRFEGLRDLAKGATRKTRKSKMSRKSKMKRKGSRGRSRRSSVAGTPKEKKATGPSLKGMTPQELVASGLLQKVSAFKDCGVTEDGFAHIAETMQMEAFATGARLCTQGEPGHKFFLITEGSCDVIIRGKVVAKLVANDSFGEIAILHDAPRSATVTATSDVVNVLSLTREAFRHVLDSHATGKGVREMESGAEAVLLNDRLRRQTTQMNVNDDGKSRRKKRRGSVVGADGKSLRRRKSRASQRKLKKKKSRRGTATEKKEVKHSILDTLREEEAGGGRWGSVRRHVRKSNRDRFASCVAIVAAAARKKQESKKQQIRLAKRLARNDDKRGKQTEGGFNSQDRYQRDGTSS